MTYIQQIQQLLNCERAYALAVFDEMCAEGFDFSEATARQFKAQTLDADYVVRMRAAMV